MQAAINMRRVPIQQILVLLTVLFTLVLGLLAGYAAGKVDSRPPSAPVRLPAVSSTGFQGPDAIERNQRLQLWMVEDTQGH